MQLSSVAQEVPVKRNTIYIEYAGQGIFNSLSFDRLYRIDKKIKTSFTAGIALLPTLNSMNMFVVGTPVSYNWIFGKKNHHLELGTGLTYLSITSKTYLSDNALVNTTDNYFYFTPKIGYRIQRRDGGFFFRLTLTPTVGLIDIDWGIKHKGEMYNSTHYSYAPYARGPIEEYPIFPWAGFSFGYTIK